VRGRGLRGGPLAGPLPEFGLYLQGKPAAPTPWPSRFQMAAFTRPDPSDRTSFEAHYQRVRSDPSVTLRAVDDDGVLVDPVASFSIDGDREVSYWINPGPMGRRPRLCCADQVFTDRNSEAAVRQCGRAQHRLGQSPHSRRIHPRWCRDVVCQRGRARRRRAHLPTRPVAGSSRWPILNGTRDAELALLTTSRLRLGGAVVTIHPHRIDNWAQEHQ
jgi:hypothetical protein